MSRPRKKANPVGRYNGTPFTKPKYQELKKAMLKDKDTAIVWQVFESLYGSFLKESFSELLATQSFLIRHLEMMKSSWENPQEETTIEVDEDGEEYTVTQTPDNSFIGKRGTNFVDALAKCVKAIKDTNEVILSMRLSMLSDEDLMEVKEEVNNEDKSLIDKLADDE